MCCEFCQHMILSTHEHQFCQHMNIKLAVITVVFMGRVPKMTSMIGVVGVGGRCCRPLAWIWGEYSTSTLRNLPWSTHIALPLRGGWVGGDFRPILLPLYTDKCCGHSDVRTLKQVSQVRNGAGDKTDYY